jgi:serine/threonine-protein kinase
MATTPPSSDVRDERPVDSPDVSARLAEVALDETLPAAACRATIRPHTAGSSADAALIETLAADLSRTRNEGGNQLPTISMMLPGDGDTSATKPLASGTDLMVVGALGAGAMGRVLLARQRSLQRDVAIKTVHPGADAATAAALLHEGLVTGQLEHPAIIPVHALGLDRAGAPALVMKRIEGVPWRRLLDDPAEAAWKSWNDGAGDRLASHLEILKQVCNAVHFAHSRGILHRDLKPDNVMLGPFGEVYVVDWGIATRLVDDGNGRAVAVGATFAGTPLYVAPEMVLDEPLDARTDVYLLGAVLHEVLTGKPLHDGATIKEVLRSACLSRPHAHDASVPEELARLCNRATHRVPDERPGSALELRQEVDAYLRHRSSFALTEAAAERLAELEALLAHSARPGELADVELQTILRVATECRFGFLQALQQWEDNSSALHGLRSCIEASIELELRRRDAQRARALLEELPEARDDLVARVAQLEREIEQQHRHDEELRRQARDMDPSVSTRARITGVLVVGGTAIAIASLVLTRWSPGVTHESLVAFAAVTVVLIAGGGFLLRRHILKNAFDRRTYGLLLIAAVLMLLGRLVALRLRTPIESTLVDNMLVFLAVAAAGALTLVRLLWWLAGVYALGACLLALAPSHHMSIFAAVTSGSMALAGYLLWRYGARRDG